MSDELKPCPFCGGEAVIWGGKAINWEIICKECKVSTRCFDTETEAIEAWNTRADDAHECDYIGGKCSRCGKDLPEPGYTGYEYEGNYCPTCGAKVRKVEPLIVKNADSYDLDTREQLEADIRKRTECSWVTAPHEKVIEWLDRQAAITRRETRQSWQDAPNVLDRTNLETIAKLTAERDKLKRRLENQAAYIAGIEDSLCRCESQLVRDGKDIDELTAELRECDEQRIEYRAQRDHLRAVLDKWVKSTVGIEPPEQPMAQFEPKDSRARLEADVYDGFSDVALSEQMRDVLRSRVHAWLDRQAAITKTEIAEDYNLQPDTSSQTVRNGDSYNLDTREQLEADAGELTADYAASGGVCDALYQGIIGLLDRQAAIIERECRDALSGYPREQHAEIDGDGNVIDCDFGFALAAKLEVLAREKSEQVNRIAALNATCDALCEQREHWFNEAVEIYRRFYPHDEYGIPQNIAGMVLAKIDELEAEVEAQRKRANDAERGVLNDGWYVCRDRYEDDIDELTAERDQMQAAIDAMHNGQFYAMYREACEERDHLKGVAQTQAESFKKMEADFHALNSGATLNTLRASVAGLKDTVGKQKAEIERLRDENAELNMQVHGAPF